MKKYSALLVVLSTFTVHAQNFTNGQAARAVLGQQNFTAGVAAPSQVILGGVSGLAFYNGTLYVADSNRVAATPQNSRIMAFDTTQIPATNTDLRNAGLTNGECLLCGFPAKFSLGQSSFTPTNTTCSDGSASCFTSNRTQSGLANATGVATDGHYFAVADTDNNRVLLWNSVPTTMNQPADIVLGQTSFTSFKTPQVVDKFSLRGPQNVWLQNNKLFVADTQNNRILIWNSIPTSNNQGADLVLGQVDFTHNTQPPPNTGNFVAAANQLLNPTSVTSDGTRLLVADLGFNRVLIWNTIPTAIDQNADVVVGQVDMTNTAANAVNVCNGYSIGPVSECPTSLNYPRFALSTGSKLFIADGGNDRVLVWNTIPTTNGVAADTVLGEPDFQQDVVSSASISIASTAIDNTGGVDLLPTPQSIAYDPASRNLYISDPYNRRVLVYTPGDYILPPNSIVNWASEIVRQEGIVQFTLTSGGAITANDTATVTISGTAYTYTVKSTDVSLSAQGALDSIAKGLVALINTGSGDANATAIFAGTNSGSIYLSSKGTNLGYDTITLAASESNSANLTATASGSYLSAGTAATGALGMIVEINASTIPLAETTATATMDGVATLPTSLGGVQVFMDGIPCVLFKVTPNQIIAQIPYYFGDRNSTSVYVRTEHSSGPATVTSAMPVYIAPANPGLFNAPSFAGQPRPWPITLATHQTGNSTAVISIDGSVTAGNIATVTISGVAYNYTVLSTDTLLTITQALINLINATDTNVTASLGGAFTRIILTAKQPGAAGDGISIAGSVNTNANVSVTAYNSVTCCVVTPNSPITAANPAAPGELINVSGVGLGAIIDATGTSQGALLNGNPYSGPALNTAVSFVTATMGATTTQVINALVPQGSYGIYNMQMIVPTGLPTNSATPLYVAQNAFISNTVSIPVGPPVLYAGPPPPAAPASNIHESIDFPLSGSTVTGTFQAFGWAFNSVASINGVDISIDNVVFGHANIREARPDVCSGISSPDCPNPGWYLNIDSTQFADGKHTLSITARSADGSNFTIAQTFSVSNGAAAIASGLHGFIDSPAANFTYRGAVTFRGWDTNDASGVAAVTVYIDGVYKGLANYGTPRPDVCAAYPANPANCSSGWSFPFDTNTIADGTHTFSTKAVSAGGQAFSAASTFQVANFTTGGSTHVSIDAPSPGAGSLSGTTAIFGWAVDDLTAIGSVTISIDGVVYGTSAYGQPRPDVCAGLPDAGCPNVGWAALIDTTLLADGAHTLAVTVYPINGQSSTYTRSFTVANTATAANPVQASIDSPDNTAPVSGVFTAFGWAVSSVDTVASVSLLIDGKSFGNAVLGQSRPDVCAAYPSSQGCPGVGWYNTSLDSSFLGNGTHVLEATVTTSQGHRASVSRPIIVANLATGPGHVGFTNPSATSGPFLGTVLFSGYALNDNTRVNSLSVTIDGIPYGTATYGLPAPDGCGTYPGRPNCPSDGWSFPLDTTTLPDGTHSLGIMQNNANGTVYTASTTFVVANYTPINPMRISIDSYAANSSGLFGTLTLWGWVIDDNAAIREVDVSIDGTPIGTATYGISRSDVCLAYPGRAGCPNVGWTLNYDSTLIFNGTHTLGVTGVTLNGRASTVTRQISIAN